MVSRAPPTELSSSRPRTAAIEGWIEHEIGDDGVAIARALAGKSALGPLSEPEQRYLLHRSLDRWLSHDRSEALSVLAEHAGADSRTSAIVARAYAARALEAESDEASAFAIGAAVAAGSLHGRRALLEALGGAGVPHFARTLASADDPRRSSLLEEMQIAARSGPQTIACRTFLETVSLPCSDVAA
jgi:hypothetical protein